MHVGAMIQRVAEYKIHWRISLQQKIVNADITLTKGEIIPLVLRTKLHATATVVMQ